MPSAKAKVEKVARSRKPQTLKAWMEAQYRATPGLRRRVNALVRKMLKEQDAAARRTSPTKALPKKRRAAIKRGSRGAQTPQ